MFRQFVSLQAYIRVNPTAS